MPKFHAACILGAMFFWLATAKFGTSSLATEAQKAGLIKELALTRSMQAGSRDALPRDRAVAGRIEETDPSLSDGTHYDIWEYSGLAGEFLTIKMNSDEVDAYLIVIEGSTNQVLSEDDDGGGGRSARLSLEIPSDGLYLIFANGAVLGGFGSYTLTPQVEEPVDYGGDGDPRGRYALLVGIEDYPGVSEDLDSPAGDLILMKRLLIDRFQFNEDDLLVLPDRKATRHQITKAFLGHLGQAGPDGVAVFYYSGHGLQTESNEGLGPPIDPEPDGVDEALYVADGSIILDDEIGFMAEKLEGRVLVILDSCFAGTGTRGGAKGVPKQVDIKHLKEKGLAKIPETFMVTETAKGRASKDSAEFLGRPQNHVLLAASSDSEVSFTFTDWPSLRSSASVFTYYLVEVFTERGTDGSFAKVMDDVREKTRGLTLKSFGEAQTPRAEGDLANERAGAFLKKR